MTVDDRDQWECLQADWSASYGFSVSDDETDEHPFKAAPHAGAGAVLEASGPRLLRAKVADDHARRAAAASAEGTMTAAVPDTGTEPDLPEQPQKPERRAAGELPQRRHGPVRSEVGK
jgi:hypothetical protein